MPIRKIWEVEIDVVGPITIESQISFRQKKGFDEDQFYIYPHTEGKVLIKSRMSRILNGRKPDLQLFRAVFSYGAGDKSPAVLKIIRDALKS